LSCGPIAPLVGRARDLGDLFKQILQLCEKAGLVKLGHVALDGTKIKANASKHKAMSYERMEKRATELEAEVAMWFGAAEAADAEEDQPHGRDQTGEEMPDWVADEHSTFVSVIRLRAASCNVCNGRGRVHYTLAAPRCQDPLLATSLSSPSKSASSTGRLRRCAPSFSSRPAREIE
jgi:hypothetical protein